MKVITNYKQHLEYEIRCPECNMASFIDTADILNEQWKECPHCKAQIKISPEFKNRARKELPENMIWHGALYTYAYTLFDLKVYEGIDDKSYGYVVLKDGKVWNENESKVTMEILMIEHFIKDDQQIEWADICIELVERYKKI